MSAWAGMRLEKGGASQCGGGQTGDPQGTELPHLFHVSLCPAPALGALCRPGQRGHTPGARYTAGCLRGLLCFPRILTPLSPVLKGRIKRMGGETGLPWEDAGLRNL